MKSTIKILEDSKEVEYCFDSGLVNGEKLMALKELATSNNGTFNEMKFNYMYCAKLLTSPLTTYEDLCKKDSFIVSALILHIQKISSMVVLPNS